MADRGEFVSGYLAGKVWQSALDPRLKPLAAALADIANDDGTCIYPSVAYIAWLLGDDLEPSSAPRMERTVQRGIRGLIKQHVLAHVGFRRHGQRTMAMGRGSTPEYRLMENNLPRRKPWREKGDNLSPMLERVTDEIGKGDSSAEKGDKNDLERVTKPDKKGDTGVTRSVLDPSYKPLIDPPEEPRARDARPLSSAAPSGLANYSGGHR